MEKRKITNNEALELIHTLESTIAARQTWLNRLGQSYGEDRNLYDALGYRKSPTFDDYNSRYKRQDIARRIVNAPSAESWRVKPTITENQGEQTNFEKAWLKLVRDGKVWHYLARADRVSGIGEYGVLLLGFDDVKTPEQLVKPVSPNSTTKLLYLQTYTQNNAQIASFVSKKNDVRYGMPELYMINIRNLSEMSGMPGAQSHSTIKVHYSRIIHIAEGTDENDIFGTPRLQCVLNRLMDVEKVAGGSAEMFWRGAFPGFALVADADANLETMDLDDIEAEMQDYLHKLQRYIRLQGIQIKQLQPQVADPSHHFDILIQLIASATNIPKRILIGSERGQLASSQDEVHWSKFIDSRREDFVEPIILRPFIDRMIEFGVLPEPSSGGYTVIWPDLTVPTEETKAEVDKLRVEALSKYVSSVGAEMVVPVKMFLKKYLGYTDDEIAEAERMSGEELLMSTGENIGE